MHIKAYPVQPLVLQITGRFIFGFTARFFTKYAANLFISVIRVLFYRTSFARKRKAAWNGSFRIIFIKNENAPAVMLS